MTRDQELFGAALMLERRHGQDAVVHAASQIAHFRRVDEPDAVHLWEAIAARIPLALERVAANPS